jgi:hypothetical protein
MQQGRPDCLSQPKSDHPRGLRRPRAWLRPRRLLLRFAHLYKKPSRLRRTEQAEAFAKFMTEPRFAFGTTHRNRKGEFTVSLSNNRTSSGPIPDRRLSNTGSLGQSCQTHAGSRQKEEQPEEAEVTDLASPSAQARRARPNRTTRPGGVLSAWAERARGPSFRTDPGQGRTAPIVWSGCPIRPSQSSGAANKLRQ